MSEAPLVNLENLAKNSYPGRGLAMGLSADGGKILQVYWLMGRSNNSRNRILIHEGTDIKAVPYDRAKLEDPSLIIYNAMRIFERPGGALHVFANGDQSDTVINYLEDGKTAAEALRSRTFEPDAPNYTPRITGILDTAAWTAQTWITKRNPPYGATEHEYFEVDLKTKSLGHCIHTYQGDGEPLATFRGRPFRVPLGADIVDTADLFWEHLDPTNKVALVVKSVDIHSPEVNYHIINALHD